VKIAKKKIFKFSILKANRLKNQDIIVVLFNEKNFVSEYNKGQHYELCSEGSTILFESFIFP